MQHKNIELMKQINTFIGEFYLSHDRTPSTTEIARKFGFSRSSAQRYLVAMNHKAMLQYCNQSVYGDKVIYVDQLVCQGVVSHVIKTK